MNDNYSSKLTQFVKLELQIPAGVNLEHLLSPWLLYKEIEPFFYFWSFYLFQLFSNSLHSNENNLIYFLQQLSE